MDVLTNGRVGERDPEAQARLTQGLHSLAATGLVCICTSSGAPLPGGAGGAMPHTAVVSVVPAVCAVQQAFQATGAAGLGATPRVRAALSSPLLPLTYSTHP